MVGLVCAAGVFVVRTTGKLWIGASDQAPSDGWMWTVCLAFPARVGPRRWLVQPRSRIHSGSWLATVKLLLDHRRNATSGGATAITHNSGSVALLDKCGRAEKGVDCGSWIWFIRRAENSGRIFRDKNMCWGLGMGPKRRGDVAALERGRSIDRTLLSASLHDSGATTVWWRGREPVRGLRIQIRALQLSDKAEAYGARQLRFLFLHFSFGEGLY